MAQNAALIAENARLAARVAELEAKLGLAALAEAGWIAQSAALDSTSIKAHRCAHGGEGGLGRRRSVSSS